MKTKGLLLGALVALAVPGIAILPTAQAQTTPPVSGTTPPAPHEGQLIQILESIGLSQGQTESIKPILKKAETHAQSVRSNTLLTPLQKEERLHSLRKEVFVKVMQKLSVAQQNQVLADLQSGQSAGSTGSGVIKPGTTPGTTSPGTTSPGTTSPGTTSPGTTSPGTTSPGTTNRSTTNRSGTGNSGTVHQGTSGSTRPPAR